MLCSMCWRFFFTYAYSVMLNLVEDLKWCRIFKAGLLLDFLLKKILFYILWNVGFTTIFLFEKFFIEYSFFQIYRFFRVIYFLVDLFSNEVVFASFLVLFILGWVFLLSQV